MKDFIDTIKQISDSEIETLLHKEYSAEELISILDSLFALDEKKSSGLELFDCCGTGGDAANTFNISTTSAVIASACGLKVCKNGGRSSSSKTGSVDVLEALGLNLAQDLDRKISSLKDFGLAFHSSKAIAETLAPLKNYARKNKISSFLSLLGPFTNPFLLKGQIIGVGKENWFDTMTVLAKHNVDKNYSQKIALIQSRDDQGQVFDELTSLSKARIRFITKDQTTDFEFDPGAYDLSQAEVKVLQGGENHIENAEILKSVIEDKAQLPQKETCFLNVALMLCLNAELEPSRFQEQMQEKLDYVRARFQKEEILRNWLNFYDFNKN